MLMLGDWWRRSLKVAFFLLLAAEMRLLDARSTRPMFRRPGSSPRPAAVSDTRAGSGPDVPGQWTAPCAGGTIAETTIPRGRKDVSSSTTDDVEGLTTQHGRRKLLRRVARQMRRLADRVDRLKQRYVSRLACCIESGAVLGIFIWVGQSKAKHILDRPTAVVYVGIMGITRVVWVGQARVWIGHGLSGLIAGTASL